MERVAEPSPAAWVGRKKRHGGVHARGRTGGRDAVGREGMESEGSGPALSGGRSDPAGRKAVRDVRWEKAESRLCENPLGIE